MLTRLVERLEADERVHGAVLLAPPVPAGEVRPGAAVSVLIATTWNGFDGVVESLRALAESVGPVTLFDRDGTRVRCLLEDLTRLELEAERLADLKPARRGTGGRVLADRDGLLDQWVRWCEGREPGPAHDPETVRTREVLRIDDAMRLFERLPPGAVRLLPTSTGAVERPLRHRIGAHLRSHRERLEDGPAERALAERIDALLTSVPQAGEGVLVDAEGGGYERFLGVADAEGFRGDRSLFEHARERLGALNRTSAAFEQGFLLPTFDAVEARFRLDFPTGGCKVPLVPAVHVGVGVTPADDLEVWAAPAVRAASLGTACVQDDGRRTVSARAAGKEPLLEALDDALADAHERVPALIDAARRSAHDAVPDARAVFAPLHLPRSHVEAALLAAGPAGIRHRQDAALALCRAATDAAPIVARKLGLAAGRLLSLVPADADGACDDAPGC